MTIDVQFVGTSLQMHGKDQTKKSKVMVAVKVTDKDVIDAMQVGLKFHQLHLRSFAAIDKKASALNFNQLCRGKPAVCRHRTAGS
jgi:hypothetical protein